MAEKSGKIVVLDSNETDVFIFLVGNHDLKSADQCLPWIHGIRFCLSLRSSVASTEKDIDTRLTKAWTAINRLSMIWKSDLTDKMKRSFFQAVVASILLYGCTTWTLTKRLEKKLDGNYTRMLRAILNKSWRQHPTRHQQYSHLPPITKTIQVRWTRHAGHCWRSRDKLISDVLLWTPTHGRAKAGRPARTYIQQLCEDTGCCPEDLPEAMNDREKWQERVRDIRATSTRHQLYSHLPPIMKTIQVRWTRHAGQCWRSRDKLISDVLLWTPERVKDIRATSTRHQLYSHLPPIMKTIQVRWTRHAGQCWRSRDKLISDVLLWTPRHGRAKADDRHEHTFSNYVRIRDVVQKTCLRRWTIGKSGERGSGISVLPARHDDDDDDLIKDILKVELKIELGHLLKQCDRNIWHKLTLPSWHGL